MTPLCNSIVETALVNGIVAKKGLPFIRSQPDAGHVVCRLPMYPESVTGSRGIVVHSDQPLRSRSALDFSNPAALRR